MNENFATEEKLYRAVYPSRMYWKENGQLSSAAFLSKSAGCSMERGDMREDVEVISHMRELNFRGHIVSVQVKNCLDADAIDWWIYKDKSPEKYFKVVEENV